jgi:hypothetical protein
MVFVDMVPMEKVGAVGGWQGVVVPASVEQEVDNMY